MAASAIPAGGIKLHGFGENRIEQKAGTASALLLRLDNALLQEFRTASHAKDTLQLLTGSTPVGPLFNICSSEGGFAKLLNRKYE